MKNKPCIICETAAELHVDDLRNHHVVCPMCGNYIATDGFGPTYVKLDEDLRRIFAAWMARNNHKPDRFLYKTRPLKSNPYNAAEGFEMVSISRIQAGNFESDSEQV